MGIEWQFRSAGGINSQSDYAARFLDELEAQCRKKETSGVREHSTSILKAATCPILDVSFNDAIRRSGLTDASKHKAEVSATSHDFVELWNAIIDLAGAQFHPLSLGRKMANGPLVPIILACACAPNVQVALERVARYKALFGPVLMVISQRRKRLRIEFRPETDDIVLPGSLTVPMSIIVVEKVRNHSARQIDPVFLALPESELSADEAEAYFGCRPVISDVVALEFTEKDAKTRFISENEALWLEVERELEQLLQERNSARPFHTEVEIAIRTQLYSGPVHVEAICSTLRVSRSTMQRRLRDEGHTYQAILDRVRFDLAERYLTKSEFGMRDISRMIGFLDPKSFFRAFKQRFGQTPEEYRAEHSG